MIEISTYVCPMEAANILNLGVVLGLSYIKLKDKMKSETFLLDVIHSWLQKEDQVEKKGSQHGEIWLMLCDPKELDRQELLIR